jgi:co-chaperonin GroES (HSP10)
METTITEPIIEKITPIGFRVLVKVPEKPQTTSSGLFRAETEHTGIPVMAQITVLGQKTLWEKFITFFGFKTKYRVGQWVYFRKYSIDELRVNTPDGTLVLYMLEEEEIIGTVN